MSLTTPNCLELIFLIFILLFQQVNHPVPTLHELTDLFQVLPEAPRASRGNDTRRSVPHSHQHGGHYQFQIFGIYQFQCGTCA